MRVTALSLVASLVVTFAPVSVSAPHQPDTLAQLTPGASRSYIQTGQPSYEVTSLPNGRARVSWRVDISNTAGRYQVLEVQIRFFDDKHAQLLEDTIKRVYVAAASKVTASHETLMDGKTASSIRTAEVSARQTGKTKSSTPAAKTPAPPEATEADRP
ncbi:MAG TPA: hypothetical protein VMU60_10885 [Syntrophobacteria bacterium]|nr:hypothetical protein [Syntrophobacteria bacterium]